MSLGFLVPQDGPEFFRELTRVGTQLLTNRADVNDLVGEQFFQQWFDQRPVAGNQREASMQLRAFLVDRCGIGGKQRRQIGRGNLGIRIEFFDNVWQLIRFRTHQATDQPFDAGRFLLPGNLGANHCSDGNQCDETSHGERRSETVQPGRLGHHHPLRCGPLFRICQRADAEPFPEGRQMAVFWLGVPQA